MEGIINRLTRHKWLKSLSPKNRKHLVFLLLLITVLVIASLFNLSEKADVRVLQGDDTLSASGLNEDIDAPASEQISEELIYVDITGAVQQSMVIELTAGSRVFDAIEAVGGLTENACIRDVNRAAVLHDGDRIYIPTIDEVNSGDLPIDGSAGYAGGSGANGKININTSDESALTQINGVGPATAQKIISYRTQNGSFSSIEEIQNVNGIGAKTFEKMRDQICV